MPEVRDDLAMRGQLVESGLSARASGDGDHVINERDGQAHSGAGREPGAGARVLPEAVTLRALRASGAVVYELEEAPDGGGLRMWGLEALIGEADDAVRGQDDWQARLHEEDRALRAAAQAEALEQGASLNVVYRVRGGDGAWRWVRERGQVGGEGARRVLTGLIVDVSAEQAVQERARDERARLLEQVARADRAKGAFLASMSHEIRTPLTGIVGFSSLLEQRLEGQLRDYASYISTAGYRLKDTLGAVLSLARLEAEEGVLELAPGVLMSAVKELVEIYRPQVEGKGLRLDFEAAPRTGGAMAQLNRDALAGIIQNLLLNAAKMTDEGVITVRVRWGSEAREELVLEVEDTGTGVLPVTVPRLFEPPEDEPSSQGLAQHSNGLRLAIARALADRLGAQVELRGVRGVGCVVGVRFKVLAPQGAPGRRAGGRVDGRGAARQLRLLLVEDAEDTRVLIEALLGGRCEVVMAVNEASAREEIARSVVGQERFDAALIDLHLGSGEDGGRVLGLLRAEGCYAALPVAAVTAFALPGDRQQFIEQGFNDYLQKPFTRDDLDALIERLIEQGDGDSKDLGGSGAEGGGGGRGRRAKQP